jgi:hypothetical protein
LSGIKKPYPESNSTTEEYMKEMIMNNIKHEARLFVRDGVPMNDRGVQWRAYTEACVAIAKLEVKEEEEANLEKLERQLATHQGLSYDEWLAKAKKLYSIHPMTSVVTSIALGPTHGRVWEEDSQIAARRRVYTLMRYKRYDHFTRGCSFKYDPDKGSSDEQRED